MTIAVSLRNKLFAWASFPVCIFENSTFLDSWSLNYHISKLEFWGSRQDCQLTLRQYCTDRYFWWMNITLQLWVQIPLNANFLSNKWSHRLSPPCHLKIEISQKDYISSHTKLLHCHCGCPGGVIVIITPDKYAVGCGFESQRGNY